MREGRREVGARSDPPWLSESSTTGGTPRGVSPGQPARCLSCFPTDPGPLFTGGSRVSEGGAREEERFFPADRGRSLLRALVCRTSCRSEQIAPDPEKGPRKGPGRGSSRPAYGAMKGARCSGHEGNVVAVSWPEEGNCWRRSPGSCGFWRPSRFVRGARAWWLCAACRVERPGGAGL